tara:strand:- start:1885 stop:2034 length:150 start_codon:yes stop_codon:yes gene_type:complete
VLGVRPLGLGFVDFEIGGLDHLKEVTLFPELSRNASQRGPSPKEVDELK